MRKLYVFNSKIRIPSREREQSYWLLLFNCSIVSDPMDCSMPGFSILHQFLEFTQTLPSNHFILCCPLLLPSVFPSIRVLSNESALRIRWPKYWSISPSNEYSDRFLLGCTGLISLQSKGHSRAFSNTTVHKYQFFNAQPFLLSTPTAIYDYWKNHSFDYTDLCRQSNVFVF